MRAWDVVSLGRCGSPPTEFFVVISRFEDKAPSSQTESAPSPNRDLESVGTWAGSANKLAWEDKIHSRSSDYPRPVERLSGTDWHCVWSP